MSALRSMAGRAKRWVQRTIERMLHPFRRRRARQRLVRLRPRRFLAVCHGNVCRSPYLAALLERDLPRALGENVYVASAGFIGPGRGVPAHSTTIAARRGLDLSAHRSQLLGVPIVGAADLVIVMDTRQAHAIRAVFGKAGDAVLVLGDLDPGPFEGRTIRDPWNQALEVFEGSFDRIERCVAELARTLARG